MGPFACSGPGAPLTIARNIQIGYTQAEVMPGLLAASLLVFALGPRRRVIPVILFGLLALHPAWTISAISGDCGHTKRDASYVFTAIGSIALCWQVARAVWSRVRRRAPEGNGAAK